ncbi:MAG TPA: TonB family protein [Steroidobacteraceae bacterium]
MSKVEAARLVEVVPSTPEVAATPAVVREAMLVDVVMLTGDLGLFQAAREAIGERNPVWRARSAEEAAELLITGRCGVLVIDMAAVSSRADTLIEQIVDQFPDVVVCVAGTRHDEPQLASLISEGLVYRFMHKPATARRAGMFLQAAIRRHAERRDGGAGARDPLLPILRGLTRPKTGVPRKYFAWFAVACVAVTLPLFIDGSREPAAPEPGSAAPAPAVAPLAPNPVAADGSRRADPVLSRARAALQAGRLEQPEGRNALDLFQAVLLAQPDHQEARQGLDRTIDLLLAQAAKDAAAGRQREAERVVRRVLSVEPKHAAALALERQVNPPDTPSRQLQREQVADARPTVAATSPPPATAQVAAQVAARAPAATGPATPPNAAAARDTRPYPDPLAPRYTNAPQRVAMARRPAARSYGAPIDSGLPVAGLAAPKKQVASAVTEPVMAPGIVAADEFDRVVARDPVYPLQALRSKTRGWVELEFTILPNGAVGDVEVVGAEPTGVFEKAAADALAGWRFRPRTVNGQPVAQRSTITMRFDVEG